MNRDVRIASIRDKNDWDRVITGQGGSTVHHFWDISTVISEYLRCKLFRFIYEEDGNIKGVFPFYLIPSAPVSLRDITAIRRSHQLLHILKNVGELRTTYATSSPLSVYGGPLFLHDVDRISREYFIENVTQSLKNLKKVMSAEMLLSPKSSKDDPLIKSLMGNGYLLKYMYVYVLSLGRPLSKIFENFDKKTRNACRQAMKRGAYIVEVHGKEIEKCYEMYLLSFSRQGKRPPIDLDLFLKICYILLKKQSLLVYLAKYKEETVAALSVFLSKPYANYWIPGFDYKYQFLRPNNLLVYHAISELNKSGFQFLDFGGLGHIGIRHYKSSYGAIATPVCYFKRYF